MALTLAGAMIITGLITAGGYIIGGLIDRGDAGEQVDLAEEQTEEQKQQALAEAQQRLTEALGELRTIYIDYDDWYNAQVAEWNEAGAPGTLEDYIREQQVSELGEYGIQRANLESQLAIAAENLRIADDELNARHGYAIRQYDEGVTAAERTHRGEAAAVAAMGVAGGTITNTVAENQRIRMEQLDLFMTQASDTLDFGEQRIANAAAELSHSETIGLGGLNQALENTRAQFALQVSRINMEAEHFLEAIELDFEQSFSPGRFAIGAITAGLQGAGTALNLYNAGVNAGIPFFMNMSTGGFGPQTTSRPNIPFRDTVFG